MASTYKTNLGNPGSRLNQAWIDYVNDNTVNGQFSYKNPSSSALGLLISSEELTKYNFNVCFQPNSSTGLRQADNRYAVIVTRFITQKCQEDDHFLMDLLDFLGNKGTEYIGKLSLWEYGLGLASTLCHEVFSKSSLLRGLKSAPLRSKLFLDVDNSNFIVRGILAKRLMDAIMPGESSDIQYDMTQYQIPLLKHLVSFFEADLLQWQDKFTSIVSYELVGEQRHLYAPEIRYMGNYLFNVLEIYKKSCDDADGQLFIPRQHIESIRKLLKIISQLCDLSPTAPSAGGTLDEPAQLSVRIKKLMEEAEHTNWPENAPQDYDPNDIKWPDPVKDPSEKDKSLDPGYNREGQDNLGKPSANDQGHSKLSKIMFAIAAAMILIYLLLGRGCKNSYLAPESLSAAGANLLKGRVQSV